MIDSTRQRASSWLNSRYIYGRVPLLHALVFLVEMAIISRMVAKFNSYYAEKPVLTIMITNAVLGGVADTVAQTLTAMRMHQLHKKSDSIDRSLLNIEIADFDRKTTNSNAHELLPSPSTSTRHLPPAFSFERLTRFMAYGFCMAPIQFHWFGFLSKAFPLAVGSAGTATIKRVACDQLMFAPFGLACFFSFMTVAEGGGKRALGRKFADVYLPTLKANWLLWPAVQVLNFRVVPLQFQIPFVSTVGIAWTAYLSLTNSAEADRP